MSRPKELGFFVDELNWRRGRDWYESHFPADVPVRGEATPKYTAFPFHRHVPERMAELVPRAKLIYVLRDPIARIVSEYEMFVRAGEERPLAELIADFDNAFFVARSRYWMQLERFLRHYDEDQILLIDSDELSDDTQATMRRVFAFASVDDSFSSSEFDRRKNVAREPPRVRNSRGDPVVRLMNRVLGEQRSERVRAAAPRTLHGPFSRRVGSPALPDGLAEYLHDDAERLRAHTGLRFENWSV